MLLAQMVVLAIEMASSLNIFNVNAAAFTFLLFIIYTSDLSSQFSSAFLFYAKMRLQTFSWQPKEKSATFLSILSSSTLVVF